MLKMIYVYIEPDPIFIPVSVRGPKDLLKFKRLRQEQKYEVALNRAYILRAIRPSVQTRVGVVSGRATLTGGHLR